jgi:hypothetical protein
MSLISWEDGLHAVRHDAALREGSGPSSAVLLGERDEITRGILGCLA